VQIIPYHQLLVFKPPPLGLDIEYLMFDFSIAIAIDIVIVKAQICVSPWDVDM
jgi:hypothetical protein